MAREVSGKKLIRANVSKRALGGIQSVIYNLSALLWNKQADIMYEEGVFGFDEKTNTFYFRFLGRDINDELVDCYAENITQRTLRYRLNSYPYRFDTSLWEVNGIWGDLQTLYPAVVNLMTCFQNLGTDIDVLNWNIRESYNKANMPIVVELQEDEKTVFLKIGNIPTDTDDED